MFWTVDVRENMQTPHWKGLSMTSIRTRAFLLWGDNAIHQSTMSRSEINRDERSCGCAPFAFWLAMSWGGVNFSSWLLKKTTAHVYMFSCFTLPVCVCVSLVNHSGGLWRRRPSPPALRRVHPPHVNYAYEVWHRDTWDEMYLLAQSSYFPSWICNSAVWATSLACASPARRESCGGKFIVSSRQDKLTVCRCVRNEETQV